MHHSRRSNAGANDRQNEKDGEDNTATSGPYRSVAVATGRDPEERLRWKSN